MRGLNLFLSFGNEIIFNDASFNIQDNDKIGLVGVNGAGKTTLFKCILGLQELDKGKITMIPSHLGYLPQEIILPNEDITVFDYIKLGRPIDQLEKELGETYAGVGTGSDIDDRAYLKKAEKIQQELDYFDQYDAEEILLDLLAEMEIGDDLLAMKLVNLSGGQKSKVAFARLLYGKNETLLLDEPTNHLDLMTKDFMIDYLKKYKGGLIVISHDIDFLNAVTEKTLYVNKVTHQITLYKGNYSYFKKKYAEEMVMKELRIEQQEREINQLREIVLMANQASRTSHKLKKMGKSKEKLLDKKLSELEVREKTYKHVTLNVEPTRVSEKTPLRVENLTFHYENKPNLYNNLSFELIRGERFLIVGENGIGKSTLLKLIMNILKPIEGEISFSEKCDVSYYAQELEILDQTKDVLTNVDSKFYTSKELRNHLGNFLFHGDDAFKKVGILSPGEKARVALCKILLNKSNFIILDEPTNHFDPDTQEIIGENFKDYTGTLLVVSHNPSFVEEIGITRMLVLPEGKIIDYSPELLEYYYYLNSDLK